TDSNSPAPATSRRALHSDDDQSDPATPSRSDPAPPPDPRPRTTNPARTHLQVPLRGTCGAVPVGPVMRFTITPLGGGRRDIAKVVGAIVRYLQPPPKEPPAPSPPPGPGGPSQYYADSGEEPGRWLGHAAHQSGLIGAVQREDF